MTPQGDFLCVLSHQRPHQANLFIEVLLTQKFLDRFKKLTAKFLQGIGNSFEVPRRDQCLNIDVLACLD